MDVYLSKKTFSSSLTFVSVHCEENNRETNIHYCNSLLFISVVFSDVHTVYLIILN